MTFNRLIYGALLSLSLVSQTAFAEEAMIFKNHYGSVLELTVAEDGNLSGYFTTMVATKDCPQVIGQKRPVLGYLTGNAMTLSISYPDCGSAVSFNGHFLKNNQRLHTTWIISHQLSTENKLKSQFVGHDHFKRIG